MSRRRGRGAAVLVGVAAVAVALGGAVVAVTLNSGDSRPASGCQSITLPAKAAACELLAAVTRSAATTTVHILTETTTSDGSTLLTTRDIDVARNSFVVRQANRTRYFFGGCEFFKADRADPRVQRASKTIGPFDWVVDRTHCLFADSSPHELISVEDQVVEELTSPAPHVLRKGAAYIVRVPGLTSTLTFTIRDGRIATLSIQGGGSPSKLSYSGYGTTPELPAPSPERIRDVDVVLKAERG